MLIVELGIIAPFFWLLWSGVLICCSWKVVNRLRQTRLFPVGLSSLLCIFVLLIPFTCVGLSVFQNYINNAYLWLLTGILFRLPDLLATAPAPPKPRRAGIVEGIFCSSGKGT